MDNEKKITEVLIRSTEVKSPDLVAAINSDKREYECRCGVTHEGDYALYDYGHHNCLHEQQLTWLHFPDSAMCPECGNVWSIENHEDQEKREDKIRQDALKSKDEERE